MDATLQAVKRETRGKNEARRAREAAASRPCLWRSRSGKAVEIAVDPKALLRILHSESGVNTLIALNLEAARGTRVLVKEYQLDPVTTSCCTPTSTASRWTSAHGHGADRAQGRAEGRQAAGRHPRLRAPRDRDRVPAGRHPENIEVDVSELMLNQGDPRARHPAKTRSGSR